MATVGLAMGQPSCVRKHSTVFHPANMDCTQLKGIVDESTGYPTTENCSDGYLPLYTCAVTRGVPGWAGYVKQCRRVILQVNVIS